MEFDGVCFATRAGKAIEVDDTTHLLGRVLHPGSAWLLAQESGAVVLVEWDCSIHQGSVMLYGLRIQMPLTPPAEPHGSCR